MEYVAVYITAKDAKEAKKISDALLGEGLVACASIIPKIELAYKWEGKIARHTEALVIAKTRKALANKIIKVVKENHSYKVPCVNFLPIVHGNPDYFKWINKETRKK